MKGRKIFIFMCIFIIFVIITIFFFINKGKNKKIGNNSSSQEIVDYILNISSYELTLNVEINSNKNSNKYILKQQYISPDISTQQVIEPSNIEGIKIIKQANNLKLENTKLNLSTVLENYEYIADNALDLSCFIEDYKKNSDSKFEEKNNEIIMETKSSNENKYNKNKVLHIDKNTGTPIKMEITDINKSTTVNILYNEVKVNNLNKDNILAFNLYNMKKEV